VAVACSNSSSNPSNANGADATSEGSAVPEASAPTETSTAEEGHNTVEDAPVAEAAACTPAPVDVATYDAGSPIWTCIQTMCQMPLAMCATDCVCNAAIYTSLQCVPMMGAECVDSSSCITGCFTATLNVAPAVGDSVVQTTLVPCLLTHMGDCGVAPADAGAEGGSEGGAGDGGLASDAAKGG
jgi:hypothetical protein